MLAAIGKSVDNVLRGHAVVRPTESPRTSTIGLLVILITFGLLYGVAMGTFGVGRARLMQPVFSAVKVPMLLLITFALSLPSFWVLNNLLGLASDFGEVVRALISTQAALTIVLASLAPVTLFWYASFSDYHNAILFNAVMFGVASVAAQWMLRRLYRPLIARNARHRAMLRGWLVIYAFVGIQLGYVLRPFIGDPESPVRFFRPDSWGNAYVFVAGLVRHAISGG
jgi:hypothetical protein